MEGNLPLGKENMPQGFRKLLLDWKELGFRLHQTITDRLQEHIIIFGNHEF